MRVIILLSFFSSLPFFSISQEKYLSFSEVEFELDIEKRTLYSILKNEGELIDGFLVIAPEDSILFDNWKKNYRNEIEILKTRKIPKKTAKDVKYVYDKLHEKFLRKYEYLAYFDQIFEKGVYNCVTAVALYAMSFEELGVPYQIKETPTHVYIIADPDLSQLLIETTDPIGGFKSFTPGFRESYVSQLGMMKLVDENDIAEKGIYNVFDEYYFGGAELSIKELIGIQYYNRGVTLFEKKDYKGAWHELSKAQLFHSMQQLNSLLFASLINTLSYSDYSDWKDIKMLPYLERFQDFEIKKTNIVGEFQRMLSFVLIENNDKVLAEKAFNYFMENSKDDDVKQGVAYSYFYERAVIMYNRASFNNAFELIVEAYKVKPGNSNAENILTESFRMAYRNKPTSLALSRLDTLMTNNPDLGNNNHLNAMKLDLYLTLMGNNYQSKKASVGAKYKELFESTLAKNPDYYYNQNLLGDAYSKSAVYYFKRGYASKARLIIKQGLTYSPDNYQLKTRLRMINN